jgi:hypothetical protein
VSYGRQKTEHAGAKNGGGFYGKRVDAKAYSASKRRRDDRIAVTDPDDNATEPRP